ncbi:MAG TPA: hypothetical protein VJY54_04140 [Lachnospiraceae bacterium]|nr:hypothetical protein [Lachnospiraceae bacterium]
MKKIVLKGLVFCLTFCIAVIVISKIINKGNNDLTVEMPAATFPIIYMSTDGVAYNELHGYSKMINSAYMRDTITVLDEGRTTGFKIDTYGQKVESIQYEVRSVDGERLIENTSVADYYQNTDVISGQITVKDLIEQNAEYEMIIILRTEAQNEIRYYTRIIWTTEYHLTEKLAFAISFHNKTFDKKEVQELSKYMESNSSENNSTLHKVNIHSSLDQLSWGNLHVVQESEPSFNVTELGYQTASIKVDYLVSYHDMNGKKYFYVEEYFRLRYTTDRIYMLDYDRVMNSLIDCRDKIYVNDKIMLGVADENLPIVESRDGNVFAFVLQNSLYTYNITTNKMSVVFSYYYNNNMDTRTLYNQHDIQIMNIDEGGNLQFVVYGYMNRGWHEGEVGIQVYNYDSTMNTIEEALYIPYDKTYQVLKVELENLLYLNPDNHIFLSLEDAIYDIDLTQKTYSSMIEVFYDDSIQVSESHKMLVWQSGGELYNATQLELMDLVSSDRITIEAKEDEYIMPLGFMEEDLIYGIAKRTDVMTDYAGRTFFPMYAVYIRNAKGDILKSYEQSGIYVTDCVMQKNQITMGRMIKNETGNFQETSPDQIMNSSEQVIGKNTIKAVVTENYGNFIQIAVKKEINAKTVQIRNPKEVLYEGGRDLSLTENVAVEKYYVFGLEGMIGIYRDPAKAVQLAEQVSGVVISPKGDYVWIKGNRVTRNQIMAIEGASVTEEKPSLAVCLDTILKYEGIVSNTEYLLANGEGVVSILSSNIEDAKILDLTGCSLDAVLYYVNQDIPILAALQDGNAVLIIGFNQYNIVLMDPVKGTIYKVGINDATEWFKDNGNCFVTYIK